MIANETGAVPAHLRRIGYVPQDGGLFPHLSVADNIGFGVEGRSTQRSKRVAELMEMVALDPVMGSRWPHELSGGQQQRVAWPERCLNVLVSCCSTSRSPRSILGCAPPRVRRSSTYLPRSARRRSLSLTIKSRLCLLLTQVAVIRDGRLAQFGAGRELYLRPKDDLTARFLGEAVLLPAQLACGIADCVPGRVAVDDVGYEGRGRIMLRPEQLQIDRADAGGSDDARWQVARVDFEGFSSMITIHAIGATSADGPSSLTMRGLSTQAPERGAKVKVTVIGRAHRMPW
jgi:iron(III) transport system ATP-binding protein